MDAGHVFYPVTDYEKSLDSKSNPQLTVFRTGQQGYIIESGDITIGIDLYMSDSPRRKIPNPVEPRHLQEISLLMGTHDHLDHIDRDSWKKIAVDYPGIRFVIPAFFEHSLPDELGIDKDRFFFVDEGLAVDACGIRIRAVAAAHEFLDRDVSTGYHPYLCYIVEINGYRILHGGDTCRYDGMADKINKLGPMDIALLPINGRDALRYQSGCIGNMTYQEAADLAGDLKPRLTIPGHYDMFAHNGEDPELFRSYMRVKYPGLDCKVVPAGTAYTYRRE